MRRDLALEFLGLDLFAIVRLADRVVKPFALTGRPERNVKCFVAFPCARIGFRRLASKGASARAPRRSSPV